ncbi:MAG: HTH-type transcriptional regulator lrs14 [Methanomassiliicoccales archaeon PtaU1.Bin124]|nr:MAG: HTH-type transcriptional regulator lrs14 [Methanomassiliicoccales archaeon PtaU1.Bin124]
MKGINLGGPLYPSRELDLRVELDKKALFALASDTRMDILKALQTDRRTLSQLAELLQVDKAAVHRHLKKLEEGGFVNRADDHGFIYYSLSWKARDIISPGENTRIVVIISTAFILLLACLVIFASIPQADQPAYEAVQGSDNFDPPVMTMNEPDHTWEYVGIGVMGIAAVVMLVVCIKMLVRPKQPRPDDAESYTAPESNVIDD